MAQATLVIMISQLETLSINHIIFIGYAHREETTHLCRIWTRGLKICSFIGQCENDKCSQNENFHMDVIFHVWVDVTLSALSFQVVEHCRF
jgi:hypothetical protein